MTQTDASRPGPGLATRALGDAAVTIELARSEQDARAAVAVLAQVWPREDGKEPLPPELAWAFAHSGNYVALARRDDRVVAAAVAFRGDDEHGPLLHSHITGVLPACQGLGVGYQLKQHQRSWALAQALDRVTWTFDPRGLLLRHALPAQMGHRARRAVHHPRHRHRGPPARRAELPGGRLPAGVLRSGPARRRRGGLELRLGQRLHVHQVRRELVPDPVAMTPPFVSVALEAVAGG